MTAVVTWRLARMSTNAESAAERLEGRFLQLAADEAQPPRAAAPIHVQLARSQEGEWTATSVLAEDDRLHVMRVR